MTHYICKCGCKGVAQQPQSCQAKGCAGHGEPLEACNCTDGKHNDFK